MNIFNVNDTVKLSESYLKDHHMTGTTMASKRGTVLKTTSLYGNTMVVVGWQLTTEGFMVKGGRPSPLEVV